MVDTASLRAAIENITRWGDTDVFPKPVENVAIAESSDAFEELLVDLDRNATAYVHTRPPTLVTSAIPVGYAGFRRVAQIDPLWNAYLLAKVIELAPDLERARVAEDVVFSHRLDPTFPDGRLFKEGGYAGFLAESRRLATAHTHVVVADIADFYGRIYHHRLKNAIEALPGRKTDANILDKILGALAGGRSYGLPVGGPAARILAELLLTPTDRALTGSRVSFVRYADDYRLFAASEDEAHGHLATLADELAVAEGLSLQKAKTRVMTATEYVATIDLPSSSPLCQYGGCRC